MLALVKPRMRLRIALFLAAALTNAAAQNIEGFDAYVAQVMKDFKVHRVRRLGRCRPSRVVVKVLDGAGETGDGSDGEKRRNWLSIAPMA